VGYGFGVFSAIYNMKRMMNTMDTKRPNTGLRRRAKMERGYDESIVIRSYV
jgi:hypothetical protein